MVNLHTKHLLSFVENSFLNFFFVRIYLGDFMRELNIDLLFGEMLEEVEATKRLLYIRSILEKVDK